MTELEHRFDYQGAEVSFTTDFDSLPEDKRVILEPQLIEVASSGFGRALTPEFSGDVKNHIRGGDLYVVQQEGEATGFAMLENFPIEGVIYIAGVVKTPSAPARVIEEIIKYHIAQTDFPTLTVRSQNDRVFEILANTCNAVVALDRTAQPDELDLLVRLGLVKADSDLDVDYLIHRGYYGSPLIENGIRRRSASLKVRGLTERLRYLEGDAAYGIGYIR